MKCTLCGEDEAIAGWDVCSMCDYRMEERQKERELEDAMEREMYEDMEREFWEAMKAFDELHCLIFPDEYLIYE